MRSVAAKILNDLFSNLLDVKPLLFFQTISNERFVHADPAVRTVLVDEATV